MEWDIIRHKLFFLLFALLSLNLVIGCCYYHINTDREVKLANSILSHTVSIETFIGTAQLAVGSGTYIKIGDGDYVLTAAHVVNYLLPPEMEGDFFSFLGVCHGDDCQAVWREDVVLVDSTEDWALLELRRPPDGTRPAQWSTKYRGIGTEVRMCGFPGGTRLYSHGIIAGLAFLGPVTPRYIIDGYANTGSSGGGLYDWETGELVGVVIAIKLGQLGPFSSEPAFDPNMVFAVPLRDVDVLEEGYLDDYFLDK